MNRALVRRSSSRLLRPSRRSRFESFGHYAREQRCTRRNCHGRGLRYGALSVLMACLWAAGRPPASAKPPRFARARRRSPCRRPTLVLRRRSRDKFYACDGAENVIAVNRRVVGWILAESGNTCLIRLRAGTISAHGHQHPPDYRRCHSRFGRWWIFLQGAPVDTSR